MKRVIFQSPKLDRALKRLINENEKYDLTVAKKEGSDMQTLLSEFHETTAETSSGFEYDSYFKIVDVSETSEDGTVTYKVAVVDGGIFDGKVDTSVKMPWLINGEKTSVNQAVIPITEETTYIYLKNDFNDLPIKVVSDEKEHPDFTSTACYKHIGRVILSDDGIKVIQDFCSGGIPETIWIVSNCNSTVGGV